MTIYALNDPEDAPYAFIVTIYRNGTIIWGMQSINDISSIGYASVLGAHKFGIKNKETYRLCALLAKASSTVDRSKGHYISGPYIFKTDTKNGYSISQDFLLMRPAARDKLLENSKL